MAVQLAENLLAHARQVLAGRAAPVVVTPSSPPPLRWPVWEGAQPSDDYDAGTVGQRPDGRVMVPTNQILEPAGRQVLFPGRANDCALSPDGRLLAVKEIRSLTLIDVREGKVVARLPAAHTFAGILFSRDGQRIYTGDVKGEVLTAQRGARGEWAFGEPLRFPARAPEGTAPPPQLSDGTTLRARNSLPTGLALDRAGETLWVVLNGNNTLAEWNLAANSLRREIPVGKVPFGVALAGTDKAYVSNWGGRAPQTDEPAALAGWEPVLIDPRTNATATGTVSVVSLAMGAVVKTIEVGLHPSAILAGAGGARVFVANTHSDTVSVIDTASDEVVEEIRVAPPEADRFGSSPAALALSPRGDTLFVANATNNAVAVVVLSGRASGLRRGGTANSRVVGYIPTGWYPGGLAITPDGKTLCVANVKGIGSRTPRADGYNSHGHTASVSLIPVPGRHTLARYSARVARNNRLRRLEWLKQLPRPDAKPLPVPERLGEPSVFEHVLYVIKENRTYDQVFGDIDRANGDPSLCLFGREVTPNQHKLVDEFVLLDNFHCSGVLSADGHQWTDEAYVTDYLERAFGGFVRSYPYDGGDAMAYAPTGFLWDNALAHGKTVRSYGEMVKARITPRGTWKELYEDFLAGNRRFRIEARTTVDSLRPHLCPTFIGFPGIVTDVYRAGEFLKELKEFEATGKLPNLMIMLLPNDHTMGTRPGVPTPRAQVADNDLALGRIVDALSHSRFWPKTVVFVTEDDPQAGLDHVDGHRTVGMVLSAYSRRGGKVIHTQYNQTSMVRTIEQILGLPPMNQFDASATPMADCFTPVPDFTPYDHVPNRVPLDEMNPPLSALSGPARHWAEVSEALPLDDIDECDEETFNRVIWHSVKGVDVPYPVLVKKPR
ncbi:MAG: alkaline phosphatase family protein [Armatimonadota bacterium]|nr:alkaline phosphatase family protein [Armatimonadota bacterium]